ncbi:MAG TPA: DUF3991 and TOPRIM domain-containing protein [Candidatus Dormibacteraeota bacterium]|nr:DUF3991 and TOPRIM domain-containing protein [Candidatus Dormibacteraeota bacterium]
MKEYTQEEIRQLFKERKAVPKELVLQAQNADIVDVIEKQGDVVLHVSDKYAKLAEHDSFVIDKQNNSFFWNSKDLKGNPINYLKSVHNYNFRNAIKELTLSDEYKTKEVNVDKEKEPFVFKPKELSEDTSKAKDYLVNKRGINEDLVDTLIDKKLIQQDHNDNVVFLWAKNKEVVGMDKQGTNPEKRFKQVVKNSDEKQGFTITNGKPENLYVFESSIDLLSYTSMYNPPNARMVSMAGLKPQTYYNAVGQIYEETKMPPKNVVFAVDSDEAGETFTLEHINNKLEHKESGITVKNHVASPRHQNFEQIGSPKSLESWKDVKDFNDILTNIQDHDTKMTYQPVVLDKDEYFEKIGYDKKYEKAMDELSTGDTNGNNVSSKRIAKKIAKYEYHTQEQEEQKIDKSKNKSGLEVHEFL